MVTLDNACYLTFHTVTTITLFRERQYLCDYATMGLNKWLSSVVHSALLPSQGPGGEHPTAGPPFSCPGEFYPTEARPSSWIPLLPYTWFSPLPRNILKISSTLPDRGIALGGSRFGFNCHFRGHIKMRLSSSKLWPDLSKPEHAHHQAQSCYKTFLGEPRLCCRFWGLGQWRGIH